MGCMNHGVKPHEVFFCGYNDCFCCLKGIKFLMNFLDFFRCKFMMIGKMNMTNRKGFFEVIFQGEWVSNSCNQKHMSCLQKWNSIHGLQRRIGDSAKKCAKTIRCRFIDITLFGICTKFTWTFRK